MARLSRTALVLAAAVVAMVAAPVADAGSPTLRVTPRAVEGGAVVVIRGSGWAPCPVRLVAYVAGVSPYSRRSIGVASVRSDGSFTRRWKTPFVQDKLPWTIKAEQQCGARRTARYAKVVIG